MAKQKKQTVVRERLEKIRSLLHEHVKDLNPADYREVLEELSVDIEGQLDALEEEQDGEPDA